MSKVPDVRIQQLNDCSPRPSGEYILYWMIATRRATYNFALDRALEHAHEHSLPLVILEPLRCDYPWASDRLHRFVLEGMRVNDEIFQDSPVLYYPWVERKVHEGKGLFDALAKNAAVVVTDDYPCFVVPGMIETASRNCPVLFESVDSNGLLPMRSTDRVFTTAASFRRFLQKELPKHLSQRPHASHDFRRLLRADPLPTRIQRKWPRVIRNDLATPESLLEKVPIDHDVAGVTFEGGTRAGREALELFLTKRLSSYAEDRNHPDENAASGLSPWLHFGHISTHEIFEAIEDREDWNQERLASKATGSREDWWGMSQSAESFLDELVTWRELGFNMTSHENTYDRYESLPAWSRQTLEQHAFDTRPFIYSLEELDLSLTHDGVWNAAQRELRRSGRMHNYLRMLWGKKILEWSKTPHDALDVMIELNNRYAVDGRDPNSYSGIFWVLGRYDRPWGPERKIFGKVRYMSSDNTRRKLKIEEYLETWGR